MSIYSLDTGSNFFEFFVLHKFYWIQKPEKFFLKGFETLANKFIKSGVKKIFNEYKFIYIKS